MIKVNGTEIAETDTEYGVKFEGVDSVLVCADKDEAMITTLMAGGDVVSRGVYMTSWTKQEDQ